MVCSACGYANQVGHRFCGMCGTPLPHRPLTAPGAHGTHTFTRFPLGIGRSAREDAGSSAGQANGPAPQTQSGVITEPPAAEQPQARDAVSSPAGMVPEIPLDDYVKSFRYVPPPNPDETTMRGEAELLRAEAVADAPAPVPVKTTAAADASPACATEDVRERLGLDEPAPEGEHHDRPRFLDFSEPTLPPEKVEAPGPAITGLSILGLNEAPKASVLPPTDTDAGAPSREAGWTWLAVAALLVVVSLGVLEWRAQGNQVGNAPVEGIKNKLGNAWRSYIPAPRAAGAAGVDAARPAMQSEEQPKPQSQDVPANAPSAALTGKSAASTANPVTSAANTQQDTPAVTETQPKAVPTPQTTDGAETAVAKPNPRAPATQRGDPEIPAKKPVPGSAEMAKANDASDAVAAAAWLSKATAKGNPDAPVRLADMYVKGDGVPRSCEQALTLLKAAANKGNAAARARLAAMYDNGTCVQRDLVKAYRWLSSALIADPSNRWALQNRDLIWQQMTPEERATEPPPQL